MAKFMEVLQTSRRSQNFQSTIAYWQSQLYQATFSCRATTKEIQRMINTINDGTLYLRGPVRIGIRILCDCMRKWYMQTSRLYAADHAE